MQTRKCTFTLIELLVVTAIIAILASLLLPALNAAKEKSQAVVCLGNLKQNNIAFQMYASDNETVVHLMQWVPTYHEFWQQRLFNSGYISAEDIFACPSMSGESYGPNPSETMALGSTSSDIFVGYGAFIDPVLPLNSRRNMVIFGGPWDTRFFRLSRLTGPDSVALICDSSNGDRIPGTIPPYGKYQITRMWKTDPTPGDRIHLRHARRANVAYADGHVEASDAERIPEVDIIGGWLGFDGPETHLFVLFGP